MILKIYVQDGVLKEKYRVAVDKHNNKVNESHLDAGFDLFCPSECQVISSSSSYKLDLGIKCAAYERNTQQPLSYYLYPRSSISKTPFRLANSVGIIDSGYRGNIMCMLDKLGSSKAVIEKHSRYFQICSPTLTPILVILVNNESDLGLTTRGSGGFGSTGK
jgi:dUTP pyrophosphatase